MGSNTLKNFKSAKVQISRYDNYANESQLSVEMPIIVNQLSMWWTPKCVRQDR
jgi:hypothetical protein